ncbi:MAG: hypothetical protein A3K04_06045 [Gallionellales bacterium RBG_16_56_9]|nr:MAG: hypothetical protein A3K04_06045 [Gallionellales bacterium RBG_16_56_9]
MKKLLISSVVAVLCTGASAIYADDTHQHEQGSAPDTKSSSEKSVLPKQPAAPDKSMSSAEGSGVADAQMGKAQERMKQAQALMAKIREAKDPAERRRLMQEHTQALRDTMGMMREMKMGMMGGCQGMGMMSCGQGKGAMGGEHMMGPMGGDQGMGMMGMHQMMEERMGMMQMMMEQMFERQEMLMQDGK